MALTPSKKYFFWAVTILFPFLLLFLVEIGLRIGGYNESEQDLFIEIPGKEEYLITNPEYPARYFPSFLPQVAPNAFKKEKSSNTYRVFVFGGSSTQGFPYNFYHSFSGRLEQMLLMETQGLTIEVINLGMTAVNSYVLWDLKDKVIEYEPDAIVVYAGHNEFYGSFGVGSSQFGLGKSVTIKRSILFAKDFRLYQLIESALKPNDKGEENRTLMARVVRDSEIDKDSPLFDAGLKQFESNITDFSTFFANQDIPVYIGTLASNLKDQAPLGDDLDALSKYNEGLDFIDKGELLSAKQAFDEAKELDGTRFRAPKEINEIIVELARNLNLIVVDIEESASADSDSGIADESLFIDHLHPNWEFNQLIGELFFEEMLKDERLSDYYLENKLSQRPQISRFEETYSILPIKRLTNGYPFTKGQTPEEEFRNYQRTFNYYVSRSYVDSVAATSWQDQKPIPVGLTDAINYASSRNDTIAFIKHYLPLSYWQVFNDDLLKKGTSYSISNRSVDHYTATLLHIILTKDRKDPYFMNTLAGIYMLNQDLERTGYWLSKSEELNPDSREMLYNFARYHVLKGDTVNARLYYDRFMKQMPQN